jgi:hypothetical protein
MKVDLFIPEREALIRGVRCDGLEMNLKILFMKREDSSKKSLERCFGSWRWEVLFE